MLVTTLVVVDDQVRDASDLPVEALRIGAAQLAAVRGLLVTVVSIEDTAFQLAYAAVVIYAFACDERARPVRVDLLNPLTELTEREQSFVRAALLRQSWGAWARAPQHVRALLGCPDPSLLLAEAARQLSIPLPTLANAAVGERLPTIRAGDRHLVQHPSTSDDFRVG